MNLNSLERLFKKKDPENSDQVMFFFLEKGIDYNSFCKLPLPYIFAMLKVNKWVVEKQEKEAKKKR